MIRVTDSVLIAAAIVGAIWTYQIKHEAEQSARKLSELRSKIARQENKITLLEADWAIMTSPGRLSGLAEKFSSDLELVPLSSSQIITLGELPELRPEPAQEQMQVENGDVDFTTTGSISSENDGLNNAPVEVTTPTFRANRAGR